MLKPAFRALCSLLIYSIVGCVTHSTIVPFQSPGQKAYAPTNPNEVAIYRSVHPFASYVELGAITYRMGGYDLVAMYSRLRKDSAAYGAQAVVDVKVTSETHTEFVPVQQCVPQTSCDANGICSTTDDCHTEQTLENVTTFLIAGSMIREKK